ncbi:MULTISPECIES: hypothetical protein [Agrobacterium]|jgi:mono/diheme cytochrome c family protein|uniref:hypothetical protein n=1 Tax=Agrobacterium tumefaciens TaxID=358 RepID=UPI001574C39A|nr:hypothetical protein [Agrobacterium tumefaciens]HZG27984.1 cytochrome c [Ensifer sp.]
MIALRLGFSILSFVMILSPAALAEDGQQKSIVLVTQPPYLPPGPGKEAFVSNCLTCHSPRYVTNQPQFPRKTWEAEVNKMIKVYGAPIAQGDVKAITDYLVHFNGRETGEP